jgi:two-component system OmpR family sensor kinase
MRLPIRARLTLVSATLMAVILAAVGAFLYFRLRADLLEAVDAGLRSRAEALLGTLERSGDVLGRGRGLAEPDDAFAQVLGLDGEILDSSPALSDRALLPAGEVAALRGPRYLETVIPMAEESVPARLLAVPAGGGRGGAGRVVVVGASLDDQREALARLATLLALGGPLALALVTWVGWLVTGAAFRPVESMRRESAAISASELGRRLPVPRTGDEIARLAETLNEMLERLQEALERERRFVGDASHELRTPLANLKAELELALRRSRSAKELENAVRSAAEETDRLARLAEDLLVLARADRGRIPVTREPVDVARLIDDSVEAFAARAAGLRVAIEIRVPDGLSANLDPLRIRQAVGNLLDNALRHTSAQGAVSIEASRANASLSIEVRDTGGGFPAAFLPQAFEPFSRADLSRSRTDGGTGLGLAIVRAVAEAHGGVAEAGNRPEGGAWVKLLIPS